jgi:hypothetical protein
MVLLGGPTAGWLLYRFVVQPRTARMRAFQRDAFWVCPTCRSVNDFRLTRCYRCDARPAVEGLEVVDARPDDLPRLTPARPGLDLGGPRPLRRPRPISRIDVAPGWEQVVEPRSGQHDGWDEELEIDRVALPDVAAMTEVIEAPGRRRTARPPSSSMPVGPGRPAVARPRRVAVAGQSARPDDDPPAA